MAQACADLRSTFVQSCLSGEALCTLMTSRPVYMLKLWALMQAAFCT